VLHKILVIAKNTFTESLRQPVYAVIIVSALLLFIISPSITMYTLDEDIKLLREIGLSTLFLTGLFIAIFTASSAVTEEIETKTITTVLSKPVTRPAFILGKFFGVAAAVILAHYICTIAMLMTTRHGVLETARDTHDWPVITAAASVIIITLMLTAFLNYTYDWHFTSTATITIAMLATAAMLFLSFIDRDWHFNLQNNAFRLFDIYASLLLLAAVIIIVALAVMFSTRFNIVITLTCCVAIFLLGLITDYLFAKLAQQHLWARIAQIILPNLQVFWISDAIYKTTTLPLTYLVITAVYAALYTVAILLIAILFFQKRQIG